MTLGVSRSVEQLNWMLNFQNSNWPIHYLISAWISKNFVLQILNINTLETNAPSNTHKRQHTHTHTHVVYTQRQLKI